MTPTLTGADKDVRKLIEYVEIHQDAGHADPASPKFGKYLSDLTTLVDNAHRVIYANRPPATIDEKLNYLVVNVAIIVAILGQSDSPVLRQALAAVLAADTKVKSIDPPEGAPI